MDANEREWGVLGLRIWDGLCGWALTVFPRGVSSVTVESGWGRAQQMRTDPIARVPRKRTKKVV